MDIKNNGSEAYLREQLEKSFREAKGLKQRVELLEKENYALKKSLYELSVRYNAIAFQKPEPFSLDFLHEEAILPGTTSATTTAAATTSSQATSSTTTNGNTSSIPNTTNTNTAGNNASQEHQAKSINNSTNNNNNNTTGNINANQNSSITSGLISTHPSSAIVPNGTGTGLLHSLNGATFETSMEGAVVTEFEQIETSDSRVFAIKQDFKGHSGPIYVSKFSSSNHFIASGSFDKTIRIWDTHAQPLSSKELCIVLTGHNHLISDLSWSKDSKTILSGSFDSTCRIWDVESKQFALIETDGFVQAIKFLVEDYLFAYSTSRQWLNVGDKRTGAIANSMKNESVISSIYTSSDGIHLVTGDGLGKLKTWDVRMKKMIDEIQIDPMKRPVSYVAGLEDNGTTWLNVNSHDNLLRLYTLNYPEENREASTCTSHLVSTFKGHKTMNLPIRSAITKIKLEQKLLLASGSVDGMVYLYGWNIPGHKTGHFKNEAIHRLQGHTDRVHSVHFHPEDLLLCTGSADHTVKLWNMVRRKKKHEI